MGHAIDAAGQLLVDLDIHGLEANGHCLFGRGRGLVDRVGCHRSAALDECACIQSALLGMLHFPHQGIVDRRL
eukprot:9985925-Lingulodinium_polyedra.AAC.1